MFRCRIRTLHGTWRGSKNSSGTNFHERSEPKGRVSWMRRVVRDLKLQQEALIPPTSVVPDTACRAQVQVGPPLSLLCNTRLQTYTYLLFSEYKKANTQQVFQTEKYLKTYFCSFILMCNAPIGTYIRLHQHNILKYSKLALTLNINNSMNAYLKEITLI